MPLKPVTLLPPDSFKFDGIKLAIHRREPQPPFPMHRHQFAELVVVTAGSGLHVIRQEEYPVSVGDVFVILDTAPHQYREMNKLGLVNVLYDPGELKMRQWELHSMPGYRALFELEPRNRQRHKFASRLRLNAKMLALIRDLLDQMEDELDNHRPGFQLMTKALFIQVVTTLARCYGSSRITESRSLLKVAQIITFMENHFTEDLTLEKMADFAKMSRRTFSRTFKDAAGETPMQYCIKLRIAKATEMIKTSKEKITGIAFDCGYNDSNFFSIQFKQIMGCTPNQYRQHVLQQAADKPTS